MHTQLETVQDGAEFSMKEYEWYVISGIASALYNALSITAAAAAAAEDHNVKKSNNSEKEPLSRTHHPPELRSSFPPCDTPSSEAEYGTRAVVLPSPLYLHTNTNTNTK